MILHCSPFESDLTIFVDPFWHFEHSGMPSVCFAFVRVSVIMRIHFEPALLPSGVLLFFRATCVRLCGLVSTFLPPVYSAHVPYIPTSHGIFVRHHYGFHRVLFSSLYALGGNIGASCVVFVFVRLEFFPCCRRSCILAYLFFQGGRCALASAGDAFKLLLTCRGDHWRHIDRPHTSNVAY